MLNWVAKKAPPSEGGEVVSVIRVTLVVEAAIAETLEMASFGFPDADVRLHKGDLASFIAAPQLARWTDVLIVQLDPASVPMFEAFERFARDHAGRMPVVAAVSELSVAMSRRILRSEAVDVLPLPFTRDELHQAIDVGRQRQAISRPGERSRGGKSVAFLSALGGAGTTALATQAGIIWAETKSVCLIDLDVQFGNAALYLDLRPTLTLADLIDAGERLDAELLRSVAEQHVSGLNVIASPTEMMPLDALTPEFVVKMLDLATQVFDIVLIDLPNAWVGWSMTALDHADAACLVTTMSVPGVHQARRQLEVVDANGMGDRVKLAVNRVNATLFRKVDMTETEAVLRRKVDFPISNDFATFTAAIDQGRSLAATKSKSRVEKDLRTMVAELAIAVEAERVRQ